MYDEKVRRSPKVCMETNRNMSKSVKFSPRNIVSVTSIGLKNSRASTAMSYFDSVIPTYFFNH